MPINRRLLAAVLCGAFVLAGCTSTPPAPPAWDEHTATDSLGDLRTIDYCSLVDTAKLTGGGTLAKPARSELTFCQVQVTEGGVLTSFSIGELDSGGNSRMQTFDYRGAALPAGASVKDSTFFPEQSCTRYLVFGDGVRLAVETSDRGVSEPYTASENGRESWCAKSDIALAGVVAAITEQRVGRLTFDAGSFGALDPCALLSGPEADKLIGADKQLEPAPHGHSCKRGNAMLTFTIDSVQVDHSTENFPPKAETIAGRPTFVQGNMGGCFVDMTQPTATGKHQSVFLQWMLSSENPDACVPNRTLAEIVLPKLP